MGYLTMLFTLSIFDSTSENLSTDTSPSLKCIIYIELVTKEKTVHMAIHNKSHHNHALMSLNKMRKEMSK